MTRKHLCLLAAVTAVATAATTTATTQPLYVDIHLPVQGASFDAALSANTFLNNYLKNSEINFKTTHTPHVTLYLTAWTCGSGGPTPPPPSPSPTETCPEQIEDAVSGSMYDLYIPGMFGPCEIQVSKPFAAGNYAMMNVTLDTAGCLQRYSDLIVNATFKLSEPNQTAPGWVNSLPEPERSEKIHDIQKYGSPNVFSQFQPHVTVAWSDNATAVSEAVAALSVPKTQFTGDIVALGSVGHHGTVLQNQDLAVFNVTVRKPCAKYLNYSDCRSHNVTAGGCSWCVMHFFFFLSFFVFLSLLFFFVVNFNLLEHCSHVSLLSFLSLSFSFSTSLSLYLSLPLSLSHLSSLKFVT